MEIRRTRAYVEEAVKQIKAKPNVLHVMVMNAAGNPVESTFNEEDSLQNAGMYSQLMQKINYVVQLLDPKDEVLSVRVRSQKHEAIITPDGRLTFIVLQNPRDKF